MSADAPAGSVIRNYQELHAAMRARADAMKLSRRHLDELSGLPDGYVSKLLAPNPLKILGRQSLGALLEVMGCRLVLEDDPEAYARISDRLETRSEWQVRANASMRRRPWLFTSKTGPEMALRLASKMNPAARSVRARRAAIARWRKGE